MFFTEDKVLMG